MARLIYFVFLAIQGYVVLGFLENCEPPKHCHNLELREEFERINYMPTTEEELNRLCPPTMEMFICGTDALEDCTGKDLQELSDSANKSASAIGHAAIAIGNLIIDLCTPGTPMRENYLASVSCFKDLVMDPEPIMKCHMQAHAVYATYEQSKVRIGEETPDEDKDSESWCMVAAYTLACFAADLHDKCGEVARVTFVDTLKRFKSLKFNDCTEGNIRVLKSEFLDFLELEEERRDVFSSVFDSKKRRK